VALLPPTGLNGHEGFLAASGDVLRGHLERTGKFKVLMVQGATGTQEPTAAQAVQAGRAAGADLAVTLRLTRLGSTSRARLAAYRLSTGELLHVDDLPAATPDDLDPVLQRLAQGLATGKPARDLAEIDTVTQKESDAHLKVAATHVFGLRLGAIFPLNRPRGSGEAALPGFGVFWLYDTRSFLAEIAIDYYRSHDDYSFSLGLGGYYPFGRGNLSPYLGGGMRYSWVAFGSEGASGLSLFGAGGVLFGRLSTVQIRAEVGYFVDTFRADYLFPPNQPATPPERRFSHGPALSAGIGF
jgi:hypothetical protein